MTYELSPEQSQYLKERGFEVVHDKSELKRYPFLMLREPGEFLDEMTVQYHLDQFGNTAANVHPSTHKQDEIINQLEEIVAKKMCHDGSLFITEPGTQISIYVTDNTWDQVANTLADKYK